MLKLAVRVLGRCQDAECRQPSHQTAQRIGTSHLLHVGAAGAAAQASLQNARVLQLLSIT
jgi:hypothetical protein